MERKFKATVNHNGSCHGIHFQMNVPVILPENAIKALGYNNVKIIYEIDPPQPEVKKEVEEVKKEEPKKEEPKKEIVKEVKKPPVNKMIRKPEKSK